MSIEEQDMEIIETETDNWQAKALIAGTLVGAVVGLITAYLLISKVEEEDRLEVSPSQGVKMGLAAFTFLRQISQIGD
jgi:hypothetical protein